MKPIQKWSQISLAIMLLIIFLGSLFYIQPPFENLQREASALILMIGSFTIPTAIAILFQIRIQIQKHTQIDKDKFTMVIIYGIASIIGIIVLPNLLSIDFEYWIIREQGMIMKIAFILLWCMIIGYNLLFTIRFGLAVRVRNQNIKTPTLKTQLLSYLIMILIGSSGFFIHLIFTPPRDNPNCMQPSIPNYSLPTAAHYNSKLDLLNSSDQIILQQLELALWSFTKLRQPCGGYPLYSTSDFCSYVGDGGKLYPNEISLQQGTPTVGNAYLTMYRLEPNPIYLELAKGAGDALIYAQLEDGGFYKYARMDENNQSIDPNLRNPRQHSSYDDNTMQGVMQYLLSLYNVTNELRYLTAINKGFDHLIQNQYEWGAWPQETNYIYPYYHIYSTLNDGLMEDMIDTFLLGIQILPERASEFQTIIDKAFDWLVEVQGNGGNGTQIGSWSQQYDFDQQPCWARAFEPPAMEGSGTAGLVSKFIDLYCFFNDTKYLDPIPAAIIWLNASKLTYTDSEGTQKIGWSRLYELNTNIPIFGLADGGPTKDPPYAYVPSRSGYSWYGQWGDKAISQWQYLVNDSNYDISTYQSWRYPTRSISNLYADAQKYSSALDDYGFWIDDANRIHSEDFTENTQKIISYIQRIITSI